MCRRLKAPERRYALNQSDPYSPHPQKIKFCLGGGAGMLESPSILSAAGNLAREVLDLFDEFGTRQT